MGVPSPADLLGSCSRVALHLEMRDGYDLSDPMLARWRSGHQADPADRESWWRPWLTVVSDAVERGVLVRRARIVSEPVSEYIRFEYDVTFTNVAAGEEIRWLPRRQTTDLALPGNDFWLFDDATLLVNHFAGDGSFTGGELVTDPATVALCTSAFAAVWERGVSHERYRLAA